MEIQIKQIKGVTAVTLIGEINGQTAPQLQAALTPLMKQGSNILFDMQHLTYISSIGIRALLLLCRQIAHQSGHAVLTSLPEMINDILWMTGFLDFFETYDTFGEGAYALEKPVPSDKTFHPS